MAEFFPHIKGEVWCGFQVSPRCVLRPLAYKVRYSWSLIYFNLASGCLGDLPLKASVGTLRVPLLMAEIACGRTNVKISGELLAACILQRFFFI
jgi:hypothetical protein